MPECFERQVPEIGHRMAWYGTVWQVWLGEVRSGAAWYVRAKFGTQ